jgi:two-component system cell cycle sensor histidine kinase/response regulator CckA
MDATSVTDLSERRSAQLLKGHAEVLEMIATGCSARSIYDAIALMYEARHPGLRCSLLELKDGRLMHGGAPSLPAEYCAAINGLKFGPSVGSCGTSTYTGERVLVESIATDPKWAKIKDAALPHGMRCCWSEPIKDCKGTVLGAFGMYYDHEALPNEAESADLTSAGRLAGIVMERDQREIALRQSEHNYRRLVENLPQRFFLKDTESRYVSCSNNFAQDLGTTPQDIVGTTDYDYFDKEHAEYYRRDDERIMRTGVAEEIEEPIRIHGEDRTILTVKAPALDEHGVVDGVLGIFRDITEQKRLEEKYNRAQKMESLGLLAGGVAHDLNNVLSAMVGYPDLLLGDLPEGSAMRSPLECVKKSGVKAAAIVSDLLTVARGSVVEKTPQKLNKVIGAYLDAAEFNALQENHKGVSFEVNLDRDLRHVSGSDIDLGKVVMNLVTNAFEAVKVGGGVVLSTTNRTMNNPIAGYDQVTEGDYVVLSVSDDGPGIPSGDVSRIFEPFYSKKVLGRSGTGLGLTVVWNVVQDHNGYIDVINRDTGLTLDLYFPVTGDSPQERAEVPLGSYKGNGERILVIDDLSSQRAVASALLTHLGYEPSVAENGEAAITYLEDHSVDLILLDMIMDPGMSGYETYKKILAIHPGQKAIIVSGYAETVDVKKTQALGAKRYVNKPYALETIGLAIKDELRA